MGSLVLVGVMLVAVTDFGPAPTDAVQPREAIERLAQIFANSTFSAIQKEHSAAPSGDRLESTVTSRGTTCIDAMSTQHRIERSVVTGRKTRNMVRYSDIRWWRGDAPIEIDLSAGPKTTWPAAEPDLKRLSVENVARHPKDKDDSTFAWDSLVVRALLGKVDVLDTSFADLVTGEGLVQYALDKVVWASNDHSRIAYHYESPEFGSATATFTKVGSEWMPTTFAIVKLADHKIMHDDRTMQSGRSVKGINFIRNFHSFKGFSQNAPGLDRLEMDIEITYSENAPHAIKRTDRRYLNGEEAIETKELVFDEFRIGGNSVSDVEKTMLPIPDGAMAFVLEEDQRMIAWTTKDGKVIKKIDLQAVYMGRGMSFSSRSRVAIIIGLNIVAVVVALFLYRANQSSKKGGKDA